jgi:hypothetical protein
MCQNKEITRLHILLYAIVDKRMCITAFRVICIIIIKIIITIIIIIII